MKRGVASTRSIQLLDRRIRAEVDLRVGGHVGVRVEGDVGDRIAPSDEERRRGEVILHRLEHLARQVPAPDGVPIAGGRGGR